MFRRDSSGIALSIDLLLALIPLTIALGFIAADLDNIAYMTQDALFRSSQDRVATDTMNTLLTTSGQPVNWQELGNPVVAGLARYDTAKNLSIEGWLSPSKVNALKASDVQNMVGNNYGFYLTINRLSNNAAMKTLGNNTTNASDIVKVERMVRCALLESVSASENIIKDAGANRTYQQPDIPEFNVNTNQNNTYDYWVLITKNMNPNNPNDPRYNFPMFSGGRVTVNNLVIYNGTFNQTDNAFPINSTIISTTQPNRVSVGVITTPRAAMNVYVVQVPKGTPKSAITYANVVPQMCRFELLVWLVT